MTSPDDFWRQLDALGEDEVRRKVALSAYGERKLPLVKEWLRRREGALRASPSSPDALRTATHEPANLSSPDSPWHVLWHLIWPARRRSQVLVAGTVVVVITSFSVWSSLPDRTKEAAIDRLTVSKPPLDAQGEIALLSSDFVLDLTSPYDRNAITAVTVQASVSSGSIAPLREATLVSFQYDSSNFVQTPGSVRLAPATPSAPVFSAGQAGTIILEFEASSLIPLGDFTASFQKGDRRHFGSAVVRLWFRRGTRSFSEDVTVPLVFEKRSDR